MDAIERTRQRVVDHLERLHDEDGAFVPSRAVAEIDYLTQQLEGAASALEQIAAHPRGGEQRNIARAALHRLGVASASSTTTGGTS